MDRANLHTLVDTLPEAALENAERMLRHLQIFPPQPPPELERMRQIRQEQRDRMRRSIRPGTMGGGGGGSNFDHATRYGHSGYSHWENQTVVHETHHFFKGHEIAVTERLRFTEDGKAIKYMHEVKGPKEGPIMHEMKFDVG
jgi:hypothetical protein